MGTVIAWMLVHALADGFSCQTVSFVPFAASA
jgi:hypothetical protein